jgi:uncharacterized protein YecE (DUF72 family)
VLQDLPALPGHAEALAQERLGGDGSQADDQLRLDHFQLGKQPRPAGSLLARVGLLVQAPFPPRRPLEVLDRVGQVDRFAIDAGLAERLVEQPAGRSHERPALAVFLVAGCLAYEDRPGRDEALAKDRLRAALVEIARLAAGSGAAQRPQGEALGQGDRLDVHHGQTVAILKAVIHLGTSGYSYDHWRHIFYPRGMPTRAWLEHYSRIFSTVELNATFYRLPTDNAVDGWREGTPKGFVFAAKGSRYLTHMKRLLDPGPGLDRYFERICRLRRKLSVVLWQLPPQMDKADPRRLESFLMKLPRKGLRHAFEFRSDAWYVEEICDLLDHYGAAFCEHDLVAMKPPRTTGGFRYLRFHGNTGKYFGLYGRRALRPVARDLLRRSGEDAYVYFNNDLQGHALKDAMDLSELLAADSADALRDPRRAGAPAVE